MSEERKLDTFSRQPSTSGHFIFFYDDTTYKFNVLFDFLRTGLKRRQVCIYHNALGSEQTLMNRMKRFGLTHNGFGSRLLVSNGNNISSQIESSLANSKPERGIRVVSNAQEYLHSKNEPSKIVEQEQVLNELASHSRVSVLCAYDSRWFNRPSWFKAFPPIIRLHNQAAFASAKGTVVMKELHETGSRRNVKMRDGS